MKEKYQKEVGRQTKSKSYMPMAILAVLVAALSLLSHRAHTEQLLLQTQATNQWAYYLAKDIRGFLRFGFDLLLLVAVGHSCSSVEQKFILEPKRIAEIVLETTVTRLGRFRYNSWRS